MGFRVHRVFISGPKKGSTEVVIDRLPGFPDGISRASDGNYWLCLVAPLSPLLPLLKLGAPVRYLLAHLLTSPLTQYLVKRWGASHQPPLARERADHTFCRRFGRCGTIARSFVPGVRKQRRGRLKRQSCRLKQVWW